MLARLLGFSIALLALPIPILAIPEDEVSGAPAKHVKVEAIPQVHGADRSQANIEKRGVIFGLLGVRQVFCEDSGYGLCPDGSGCCPIGGRCCEGFSCCDAGEFCCDAGTCCPDSYQCCRGGGCCEPGYDCIRFRDTGTRGCCPTGEVCREGPDDICEDAGWLPCEGELSDYCCPPGDTCFRDNDGDVRCRNPLPTITRTTSTRTFTSTSTSRTTSSFTLTQTPTVTSTGPQIIDLDSPEIHWEGEWSVETSPCDPDHNAKRCSGSNSSEEWTVEVTFSVNQAVSLSISASSDASYEITANGQTFEYFTPPSNSSESDECQISFTWDESLTIGATTWSLSIKVTGPAPESAKRSLESRQDGGDDWFFQINQLLVTESDSQSSSSSRTSSRTSTSPFQSDTSEEDAARILLSSSYLVSLALPIGLYILRWI